MAHDTISSAACVVGSQCDSVVAHSARSDGRGELTWIDRPGVERWRMQTSDWVERVATAKFANGGCIVGFVTRRGTVGLLSGHGEHLATWAAAGVKDKEEVRIQDFGLVTVLDRLYAVIVLRGVATLYSIDFNPSSDRESATPSGDGATKGCSGRATPHGDQEPNGR